MRFGLAILLVAAAAQVGAGRAAMAANPLHPDWPCVQAKVPELSVGAVWAGPPIDDVGDAWREDPELADLVLRIAARRTPLEEAKRVAAETITGSPAEREEKAKLLFAGLFETLNHERTEVMNGLERLTRRQRDFAGKIEADAARLRALRAEPDPDQREIDELVNQIQWETRIFEERRKAVRYVCEVPVKIERRFFGLARAIQQELD